MTAAPRVLLFDLGGVLVDIDFERAIAAWAPYSALTPEQLRAAFGFDEMYRRHERGEIEAREYFDHLRRHLCLTATDAQIEAGWNAIFLDERSAVLDIAAAMRPHLPCHVFSNTNAAHMAAWSARYPRVMNGFDRIFVSHELGVRKPERAAFERVAHEIGVAAGAILFFDDLAENAAAACAAGLLGVHAPTAAEVRAALRRFGYEI